MFMFACESTAALDCSVLPLTLRAFTIFETCTLGLEFLQFENVLACATFLDPTFLGKTC